MLENILLSNLEEICQLFFMEHSNLLVAHIHLISHKSRSPKQDVQRLAEVLLESLYEVAEDADGVAIMLRTKRCKKLMFKCSN